MNNRDINSITYLFSEMDPTEEVEFERSLNDNENLLIEVESFRKVTERLNDLPHVDPPKELCDSVCTMAANRSGGRATTWHRPLFFAAAAVLFAGFTATALMTEPEQSSSSADQTAQASASSGTILQAPSASSASQLTNQTNAAKPAPWIDNNEVIRFSDRIGQAEAASFDSIFRSSYQRLTPVTETDPFRGMQRQLQLTGSRP